MDYQAQIRLYIKDSFNWLKSLSRPVWLLVGAAFLVGVLITGPGETPSEAPAGHDHAAGQAEVQWWTCSMHPNVKLPEPGLCPICRMDLIPVAAAESAAEGPTELKMSPAAVALAGIRTAPVRRNIARREVRLSGKLAYDETRVKTITAWVPGRIERLYVDYTGIAVKQGDHLAELYSPELYAAQEELIQAAKRVPADAKSLGRASALATLEATREKFRLWGLTDAQIRQIEKRGAPSDRMTIYSPIAGVVVHKNALQGLYVSTGSRIYTVADLSRVWVILDAYESDLPWLRFGQEVDISVQALPGRAFQGRIAFIDPVLDEKTRTVKVRLSLENPDGALKPGLFAQAVVHSVTDARGQAVNPAMAGKWVSPMHPEIVKDHPGQCDVCGMDLVRAEDLGIVNVPSGDQLPLVVPAGAVLLTGKRAIVYVRKPGMDEPVFEGREVVLGGRAGDVYIVLGGLAEGEEEVVNGNFKIDSAMQIAAKPSMMNPEGGVTRTGHEHHGMDAEQPGANDSRPQAPAKNSTTGGHRCPVKTGQGPLLGARSGAGGG